MFQKLFARTVGISDNVDNLLHGLDEVSLKLSLSQNEFQGLRNTQFIESRVYEDDETLDYKEEVKVGGFFFFFKYKLNKQCLGDL